MLVIRPYWTYRLLPYSISAWFLWMGTAADDRETLIALVLVALATPLAFEFMVLGVKVELDNERLSYRTWPWPIGRTVTVRRSDVVAASYWSRPRRDGLPWDGVQFTERCGDRERQHVIPLVSVSQSDRDRVREWLGATAR